MTKLRAATAVPQLIVGENIRINRRRQNLTQEALADKCGVHPVELGRAERGVRDMRVSTVAKIAKGLEIPAGELLKGIG